MHRSIGFALLLGCGGTSPAPSPEVQSEPAELRWRDVTSDADLFRLAAEAHADGRALLLDVRADWCVPCRELESETFADPWVKKALGDRFVLARLDATDPAAPGEALQGRLGVQALPKLLFWSMNAADAEAFAAGKLPPAAKTISTFVAAGEFLPVVQQF